MRAAVRNAFTDFSIGFEGYTNWLYCDVKGLVTTGIGNLADPISLCPLYGWVKSDGSMATPAEVIGAWHSVKDRQDLKLHGGGAYRGISSLRLSHDGVTQLVLHKLDANETILRGRVSNYDTCPADAQLALHSMSWALGANFNYPKFQAAFVAGDFATAATESHMNDEGNPGLTPRNAANKLLLLNAAFVVANSLDPDVLYYPGQATVTQECEPSS